MKQGRCQHLSQSCGQGNIRQHFNYLRNNSSAMYNVFTWGGNCQCRSHDYYINAKGKFQQGNHIQQCNQKGQKRVSFDDTTTHHRSDKLNTSIVQGKTIEKQKTLPKQPQQKANQSALASTQKRPQSAPKIAKDSKVQEQKIQRKAQNRQKVKNYINEMIPFSRDLPNSKFQEYYGRAAIQTYGRANTNEPIGGIIYGNHLKTFNINPHSCTNDPKYYQTHTTALNFGKRTKLNQQGKWVRLQKQLTKKLGLLDRNQSLKQGKQIVYVDVDDNNMYEVMKQNNQFVKAHRNQIRASQTQYKIQKQKQKQAEVAEFYQNKKNRIQHALDQTLNTTKISINNTNASERIKQQLVYKHHDQHGNVRYATDRHGITCFVDMNFPQNDAAYTAQLNGRMPIFPVQVKQKDKHLDQIRRDNYGKSLNNVYPSHYLLPNCQQPQIMKMLSQQHHSNQKHQKGQQRSNRAQQSFSKNKTYAKQTNPQTKPNNINKSYNAYGTSQNQSQGYYAQNKSDRQIPGNKNAQNKTQNNKYAQNNIQINQRVAEQCHDSHYKTQLMDKAFNSCSVAEKIIEPPKKVCCGHHLSNNQRDPYYYKKASEKIGQVPLAGNYRN